MLFEKIAPLLEKVQKPSRYTGGEYNQIVKDHSKMRAKMAFCFPDSYDVGMSHLGIKILYHAVNAKDDLCCERVFAPWPDMEELMRENDIPLYSLETKTPIGEFDVIGFTLQYEMSYTNLVNMLDMGGVKLLSMDRAERDPIVVAGGPCSCNPEPIADIIDVFLLGDGEYSLAEFMEKAADWKESNKSREDFLLECAKTPGLYVPRFYKAAEGFGAVTPLRDDVPAVIDKTLVEDFENARFIETQLVPYSEIVFDRIMLEIARGCTRGCRFCQAGYIYRPVRERSVNTLFEQAKNLIEKTGYEEISLSSLSTGDYSCLPELAEKIITAYRKKHVNLSLPSLRIDSVVKDTLVDMGSVKKTGLTFAPEAGSQRLRDVINKGVSEMDLLRSVSDAFEAGYTNVKLYFMIGLPTENKEDLSGIADLAKKVRWRYMSMPKEMRSFPPKISVSASTFVPKPHTAFQWEPQDSLDMIMEKQEQLRQEIRIKNVEFSWHEPYTSELEAVFSRGDRHLSKVLIRAHELGCKFDGWSEYFDYEKWQQAFSDCGLSIKEYAQRRLSYDDPLPWDHINYGVSKQYLISEHKKAMEGIVTPDCRGNCHACGVQKLCKGVCPTCEL